MTASEPIQGMWVGNRLSRLEQLSIRSFLAHGHEFHLYVYEDVAGVPKGTVLRDGNEILPASSIFLYRDYKSYAGFSNFFRYKLLLERGGWWVDLDLVCLRPFCFPEEHVFGAQHNSEDDPSELAVSGIMRAPAGSAVMQYAWEECSKRDPATIRWGETGPLLIRQAIAHLSLSAYVKPARMFCPLPYYAWSAALIPGWKFTFRDDIYAVHLWNELWRRSDFDKDQTFDETCLYEKLKAAYPEM